MDYVVFGMGYGATLMLLGWVLRTFGPGLRYRAEDDAPPLSGKQLLARTSWRRFAAGLGAVIASAGLVLVFLTFLLILIHPTEGTGVLTVLLAVIACLVAVAVWLWLYVGRYGTYGLVPERKPSAPATAPVSTGARPLLPSKPAEADVAPAVALSSNADASDSSAPVEEEPLGEVAADPYAFGPTNLDEAERHELEIRMSRYHVHHPEPDSDDVVAADDEAAAASEEMTAVENDLEREDDVAAASALEDDAGEVGEPEIIDGAPAEGDRVGESEDATAVIEDHTGEPGEHDDPDVASPEDDVLPAGEDNPDPDEESSPSTP